MSRLMKRNETKYIECTDCEDGMVYVDTSRSCGVVRGECCGGCGYSYPCEECEGTGEIELEIEPTYIINNKTRNRKTGSKIYQHHWKRKVLSWQRLFKN